MFLFILMGSLKIDEHEAQILANSFLTLCFDSYERGGRVALDRNLPLARNYVSMNHNGSSSDFLDVVQQEMYRHLSKTGMTCLFDSDKDSILKKSVSRYFNTSD